MTTKIKECTSILQNMHEMMTIIIDTGNDQGMSALDILEDCLKVERLEANHKKSKTLASKEIKPTKPERFLN